MLLFRRILMKTLRFNNLTLFFFTTSLILASSVIIYMIEPENFENPFVGFWWVMTTITTVGYGDYAPLTLAGRLFAIFLYIIGIGLIGVVIGKVVDSFSTYRRRKEEGKLAYRGKQHYVIIGWSDKAKTTIEEILLSRIDTEVVLIDRLEKSPYFHNQFHYVQGDPTEFSTLERANVLEAESVIIFSPHKIDDPVLCDGQTLLIASTIESYEKEKQRDIYTIVEIASENHVQNFKHVKIDEYIISSQSISYLMARTSLHKGSSSLYMQLLSRQYGDDLYEIKKQRNWTTYRDANESLSQLGANLIADRKDFSIIRRLDDPIPEDARLYVICDRETYTRISQDA